MAIPIQVTFDCADPARVASFWAEALGYKLQDPPEGYTSWPDFLTAIGVPEADWNKASAIVDPEGRGPRIYSWPAIWCSSWRPSTSATKSAASSRAISATRLAIRPDRSTSEGSPRLTRRSGTSCA